MREGACVVIEKNPGKADRIVAAVACEWMRNGSARGRLSFSFFKCRHPSGFKPAASRGAIAWLFDAEEATKDGTPGMAVCLSMWGDRPTNDRPGSVVQKWTAVAKMAATRRASTGALFAGDLSKNDIVTYVNIVFCQFTGLLEIAP